MILADFRLVLFEFTDSRRDHVTDSKQIDTMSRYGDYLDITLHQHIIAVTAMFTNSKDRSVINIARAAESVTVPVSIVDLTCLYRGFSGIFFANGYEREMGTLTNA